MCKITYDPNYYKIFLKHISVQSKTADLNKDTKNKTL